MIWRVDDTRYGQTMPLGPYQLMRPGMTNGTDVPGQNYRGSFEDAWDPDDFSTPQRTMLQPWTDGSPSKVAVRAIGGAGDRIRAYLDVRGPGILVDPSTAATEVTMLTPEPISFPVLNTGEVAEFRSASRSPTCRPAGQPRPTRKPCLHARGSRARQARPRSSSTCRPTPLPACTRSTRPDAALRIQASRPARWSPSGS